MTDISFHHGTRVQESNENPIFIRTAQSAVVAIIGTAPDADATTFPLNTPVLIKGTADIALGAKLGSNGTLKDALDAVFDQVATYVYIIRVEEGADNAATISNIVGDVTGNTGVHALKSCEAAYGRKLKPRLVCVPGYTAALSTDGITSIAITNGGSGYSATPTVTISGDGNNAEVEAVVVDGVITGININKPGFNFTTATVVIADDTGSGAAATANIGTVMNPVVAELQGILKQLRAVAFVDGPNTTDADAVAYRALINSQRIYICDNHAMVWDTDLDSMVSRPTSAHFAGVQARVDRELGFWNSVSNKAINGITGMNRPIMYGDQTNYLNENHVNTIVNLGSGFITWGNRVTTDIDVWKFLSVRRTADFINEAIEDAYLEFVDKVFSKGNLIHMIESGNTFLQTLKSEGAILGGEVWINEDLNPASEMAQGRLTLSVKFEPPAPMEDIRFIAHRETAYYEVLLDAVLTERGSSVNSIAA